MAINGTTLGIVLTKIRDILDRSNQHGSFERTKKAMRFLIMEQIGLIGVSLVALSIYTSAYLHGADGIKRFLEVSIIALFVYSMLVLLDAAKSVFVLLDFNGANPE
jgi:hypothetical protein